MPRLKDARRLAQNSRMLRIESNTAEYEQASETSPCPDRVMFDV
jgi:hypothetical protein